MPTVAAGIASTPEPPYFAVIFTSLRTEGDQGYGKMSDFIGELASGQEGFLGIESARTEGGLGITVSYWASEDAIAKWKANRDHRIAQNKGMSVWYEGYTVRIARVERAYTSSGRTPV
jgi:heme-degrading monooxygenase HmoA